jgi:hypothetical protein
MVSLVYKCTLLTFTDFSTRARRGGKVEPNSRKTIILLAKIAFFVEPIMSRLAVKPVVSTGKNRLIFSMP